MNANDTETELETLRNLLSPIKNIAALLRILEKNGIEEEYKKCILDVEIPEILKICDHNKKEIFRLATIIDTDLITYLEQCYELNDSLLDSPQIDHLYEIHQYEKEVLDPIMKLLVEAQIKEQQRMMISSLFEYYLFKESGVKDRNREYTLKNKIEEFIPHIEEIIGTVH